MTVRSETDVVLDHALLNEENIAVAALIYSAFDQLCGRIITRVLEPLTVRLKTQLGSNWQLPPCLDINRLAERYSEYLVVRSGRVPDFKVLLSADESGYP